MAPTTTDAGFAYGLTRAEVQDRRAPELTRDRAEGLLPRARSSELHLARVVAHRRADPTRRVASQPAKPSPRLRGLVAVRAARFDELAVAHRPREPSAVARELRG